MGGDVVAQPTGYDDHVGLGLRPRVERDRLSFADVVRAPESPFERRADETHRGGVASALRLPGHEQAVQ